MWCSSKVALNVKVPGFESELLCFQTSLLVMAGTSPRAPAIRLEDQDWILSSRLGLVLDHASKRKCFLCQFPFQIKQTHKRKNKDFLEKKKVLFIVVILSLSTFTGTQC